ncbi:imidazoleglycerol-phosphate dehydratase [Natranaerovirga hydrolytica]|uniref:Imidazoleglycerol-phosphate dehydratase n=1 Tax=Natranaerovirga hydrolytica TaxID=680378 RepID=A0A4R1N6K5_9FIRM|nr:imidazoleglycerol-phosphate dehydratase HisB [Natranaerovirga hydrolytica]TCK98263.1 imidazoleglycerol-phosphate dehydratase [Natranaerovirga hydrolytica]
MNERKSTLNRVTKETNIQLSVNIDGSGQSSMNTGIGFFDHMLTHISKHGFFDMEVLVEGDLDVDCHHTIEDVGIVLGNALKEALKDKKGIKRYGSCIIPMDETLVLCAIDLSGRAYLNFEVPFTVPMLGSMQTEMVEEFFRGLVQQLGINLHIKLLDGKNNHHIAEGIFKAFGKALDEATMVDPRIKDVLSTKGTLD